MLDIHISLMLLAAVVFLVLLVTLNNRLYQPLLEFMDARERNIKRDLEAVNSDSTETDEMKAKAAEAIAKAKSDAAALRARTIEESKELAETKLEAKRKELAGAYDTFLAELDKEETQIKSELLSQIPLFKESLKAKFSQF